MSPTDLHTGNLVRLMFPLLLGKGGKPLKLQPPVRFGFNGRYYLIPRGVVVEAPDFIPVICEGTATQKGPECFTSKRATLGEKAKR